MTLRTAVQIFDVTLFEHPLADLFEHDSDDTFTDTCRCGAYIFGDATPPSQEPCVCDQGMYRRREVCPDDDGVPHATNKVLPFVEPVSHFSVYYCVECGEAFTVDYREVRPCGSCNKLRPVGMLSITCDGNFIPYPLGHPRYFAECDDCR